MEVRDAMTTRVVSVAPDSTLVEAAVLMRNNNVGSLVVLDEQDVVGILTDRDITTRAVAITADLKTAQVKDYMSADPISIPPHTPVMEALDLMKRRKVKRLPVVFAGGLEGIIALADVAQTLEPETRDLVSSLRESRHNV